MNVFETIFPNLIPIFAAQNGEVAQLVRAQDS